MWALSECLGGKTSMVTHLLACILGMQCEAGKFDEEGNLWIYVN